MNKDKQPFTPESVDDEIDRLINSSSSTSSKARLVHELHNVCKENADSLKRVWERIERYSTQQQTFQERNFRRPYGGMLQRQALDYHILPLKKRSNNTKYPASHPFTVLVASIIGIFLVGSLAWALALRHPGGPGAARPDSSSISVLRTSQATNATPTQLNTPSQPMTAIHMLDIIHGWALTRTSIFKTADGGIHWQDVTPANAFNNATPNSTPQGDFLNDQDTWVVTPVATPLQTRPGNHNSTGTPAPIATPPQGELGDHNSTGTPAPVVTFPQLQLYTIRVLRTTDGGKSWQSSTIPTLGGATTDMPHFLNPSDGWLQTFGQPGSGQSTIFFTTDGGQHWRERQRSNQRSYIPDPTGISFRDMQTGWATGDNPRTVMDGTINNAQPLLEITHDGGLTWLNQTLPVLPEAGKSDMVSTRPPVFSGNDGLLPVEDQIVPARGSKTSPSIGLNLYVTHNGGRSWTPTRLITSTITSNGSHFFTVSILDMQHVWAAIDTNLYATSNGGQSWTQLPPTPQPIGELSFVDPNNGWAIGPGNAATTSPELLRTTDGGHTWQQIT